MVIVTVKTTTQRKKSASQPPNESPTSHFLIHSLLRREGEKKEKKRRKNPPRNPSGLGIHVFFPHGKLSKDIPFPTRRKSLPLNANCGPSFQTSPEPVKAVPPRQSKRFPHKKNLGCQLLPNPLHAPPPPPPLPSLPPFLPPP